jgi:adenylosuccinate lyase
LALASSDIAQLENLYKNFDLKSAEWVKTKEKETNHDLKAVEYYIKTHTHLKQYTEYFHILCTSEDINNLAYSLMFSQSLSSVLIPVLESLLSKMKTFAKLYASIPMLSRTHGQPASPTTVGKEIANFVFRIERQVKKLKSSKFAGKCNGAVGNFNVHLVTYPEENWRRVSKAFIEGLGLEYNPYTTQIEPHDTVAEVCGTLSHLNTILLDFSRDMWGYISLGYFRAVIKESEVGSSTMPHKVNPIDFENAEGNLGVSNSILVHLQHKLPVSRFQRDLSDSTAIRNVGVGFGHSLISYKSIIKGLDKLRVNEEVLVEELNKHWEVLAEPVQMVLRKNHYPQPYELLKQHTRGKGSFTEQNYRDLIVNIQKELKVKDEVVQELLRLTPTNYVGLAKELALQIDLNEEL